MTGGSDPAVEAAASEAADTGDEPGAAEDVVGEDVPLRKRAPLRSFPVVVADAVRLVWQATGRRFLLASGLQLASGLGAGAQLVAARWLLDEVLEARRVDAGFGAVLPELLVLVAVVSVTTGATVVQAEYQRVLGELVNRHVQGRVMDIAVSVDLDAYESPEFFDRLQRAQVGGQMRPWQMTVSLLSLLNGALSTAAIVAVLVSLQPLLLPLVGVSYLPLALASVANSRASHAVLYRLTGIDRERNYFANVLTGREHAKEVRLFHLTDFLRGRYERLYQERIERLEDLMRRRTGRSLVASVGSSALAVGVLAVLVALLLAGRMDVASATAAAVGLQQLGGRLQLVYGSAGGLFEGSLFVEDYREFLRVAPERGQGGGEPAPAHFDRLEARDLTFHYPGSEVRALDGVSLEINAGEVVALVGENGSGKTTLAKLLSGLHLPTSGTIEWDGVDVTRFDREDLRRGITCVFQDFGRYQLSARDNIAIGRHEDARDTAAVTEAARRAGADEFVSRLPEGLDTRLGRMFEGGVDLSIGQWQRVAIARALFRQADFIILDEPTAALDPRVEHELFRSMRDLARGKTVLVISHRFSSVRSADRVYVLDGGRIVEQGSHDQLMARGGLYAELFTLQAAAYLEDGTVPEGEGSSSGDGVEDRGHGVVERVPAPRPTEAPAREADQIE